MELQEAVLAHGRWNESTFVGVQFVTQCWRDRNSLGGPSVGREMLTDCACHLGFFVCKTLFVPRLLFFHCCSPLIKRVFSPYAACIHLVSVPRSVMLVIDLLKAQ